MKNSAKAVRSRREDILHAATALFAQKGFDGVSTRDISRAVGVNIATLYHYFPDKQSIYDEVAAQAQIHISNALAEAASGSEPPLVRLQRFIATLVRIYSQETSESRLIDRQQLELSAGAYHREHIWPTHQAVLTLIGELYENSLDEDETDEEARFLISLVYGATKLQPVHRIIGQRDPYAKRPLEECLFDYYSSMAKARRETSKFKR